MKAAWLLLALALAAPAVARAQACPEGRPATGDPGIDRYLCIGGACDIWRRTSGGVSHRFTTEPRIARLEPDHPVADRLEVGDVLVAVDEILITTPAGGRHLANLEPGRPVELWIRRDGRDLRLTVTPPAGCGPSGLSVRIPGVE